MNFNFTDEQILAIELSKKNILVSASAGSGKTSVLVERIIKIIIDNDNVDVDIDKILAVTFTDAAALEIKKRIAKALYSKVLNKSQNENIKRQIVLLDNANICTLHAFCMKLLKKYFYLIDIDPNFRVAQPNEIELLKYDILDKILEDEYASGDKIFFETAFAYNTDKIQSDSLKKLILKIYDFSRSIPDADKWLNNCAEKFNFENKNLELKEFFLWPKIFFYVKDLISQAKNLIKNCILICKEDFGPEKYILALEDDLIFFDNLDNKFENDFDLAKKMLERHEFKKIFSYTKKNLEEYEIDLNLKELVIANRKKIKKIFENMKDKIFFAEQKFILKDIYLSYDVMNKIAKLVSKFHEAFKQKKIDLNILSFDDLEELALEILIKKQKYINNSFYEILIDEYQDINDVQEKILSLINCESRFFVGDVKQSIYGFRNSSPELFINKYNNYLDIDKNLEHEDIKINLTNNFRTSSEIIRSINFFFSKVMTKKFGGVNYMEQKLIANNKKIGDKAKFYLLVNPDEKEIRIRHEAEFICNKIKFLVDNNLCDGFADIAVLIRSRSNLKIISQVFLKNNIPVAIEDDINFFELPEIMVLVSFLKLIDNSQNDIALVCVLRSKIYNISDDELLKIRLIEPNKNFYYCVKKYVGLESLEKFKSDLECLRLKKNFLCITKLINELLDLTDFFYVMSINNAQAKKNIIRFINLASEYENSNYKSLFDFIRYLERLDESKINLGMSINKLNAVKIMTIHKSKGLEFEVVFLSFLDSEFNFKDLNDEILLDKNLGFGNKYINIKNRTKINTITRNIIKLELKNKKLEEELRLLYVAMTRAKNKLFLTGSVKDFNPVFLDYYFDYDYKNAKNFLDWLMPVIFSSENKKNLFFDYEIIKKDDCQKQQANIILNKEFNIKPVPVVKVSDNIKNNLEWKYPYDIFIRSKTSIQELNKLNYELKKFETEDQDNKKDQDKKNNFYDNHDQIEYMFERPKFFIKSKSESQDKISASDYGSLVHNILRRLGLNININHESIKNFLDIFAKKNMILPSEKKIIYSGVFINKLVNFLSSELFYKIKHASFIKREAPFVLGLDLDNKKNNHDQTLIHGIIDCFFEYDHELYLLDYKTNRFISQDINTINNLVEKYRLQLEIYKSALEKNFNKQVNHMIIYFFEAQIPVYL